MHRNTFVSIGLLVGALGALGTTGCTPAAAPSTPGSTLLVSESPGIVVAGRGELDVAPDVALVTLGVEVTKKTVAEARDAAAEDAGRVIDALARHGVVKKDVQTSGLEIAPRYEYGPEGRTTLVGYGVSHTLTVKVRALGELSRLLDDAVTAGGDSVRLQGVRFELEDPTTARRRARELAMQDARRRAEELAALSGAALGSPISIEETQYQPPVYPMRGMLDAAAKATPVEAGTSLVAIDVRARWEIRRD
ncbi:MAG: SIMPL domain-containing protein [Polyangiaceae bacterium]|nr:SIMPL domain-containing protein [Polyangiaceae bacterium]